MFLILILTYDVTVVVEFQPETHSHGGQNLFDLVQRFPPEVFGLEHFAFALLDQLADRSDLCVLQTVI